MYMLEGGENRPHSSRHLLAGEPALEHLVDALLEPLRRGRLRDRVDLGGADAQRSVHRQRSDGACEALLLPPGTSCFRSSRWGSSAPAAEVQYRPFSRATTFSPGASLVLI